MPASKKTQWSDTDKALWFLENGYYTQAYSYYYAESTNCYFRRPYYPVLPWIDDCLAQIDKKLIPKDQIVQVYETEQGLFKNWG